MISPISKNFGIKMGIDTKNKNFFILFKNNRKCGW